LVLGAAALSAVIAGALIRGIAPDAGAVLSGALLAGLAVTMVGGWLGGRSVEAS
jgi:hypothetical protein